MFELLDTKPKVIQPDKGVKIKVDKPASIEFRNVSFHTQIQNKRF